MNDDSFDLDALEAEFGLDDIVDDPAYGGLLDSVSQAFMYDKQLIEARQATQAANISAKTVRVQRRGERDAARLAAGQARAQRKQSVEQKRAMRAQTATVKSQASQERLVATEQARAEQQRVVQERARKNKEAARLAQMRVATQQEGQQRRTASTGQRRDTAETRRSVAQVSNVQLLTEATADPTRIVTKDGAPIQAAAALSAPIQAAAALSAPAPAPAEAFTMVGAEPETRRFPILGYVLVGSIIAAMAGAFYVDAHKPPAPPPAPRPRYPRLPIPG